MTQRNLRPFIEILVPQNGDADYNTGAKIAAFVEAAGTGSFVKIWQRTVPAQSGLRWGSGNPRLPENQGRITFAALDQTTAFSEGQIEFRVTNAAGTQIEVVSRLYSGNLHNSSIVTALGALEVDQNKIPPFPEQGDLAYEDSRIEMWYKAVVDGGTVDQVAFRIPATVYAS